jgi:hypothetical protein
MFWFEVIFLTNVNHECKTCNKIEDEEHFILECTINSKLRTDLFAILANENPTGLNNISKYYSCTMKTQGSHPVSNFEA